MAITKWLRGRCGRKQYPIKGFDFRNIPVRQLAKENRNERALLNYQPTRWLQLLATMYCGVLNRTFAQGHF